MEDIFVTSGGGGLAIHVNSVRYAILNMECSGFTWSEDQIFVLHRNMPGVGMALNVLDESLEPVDHFALGELVAPHQIYYWDGVVLITDTGQDRIVAWNVENHDQEIVYTGDKPGAGYLKNNHINSIWCDGEKFYICEHKCGPSSIRALDSGWKSLKTFDQVGGHIHDAYVEDGKLYTCDSWGHGVLRVDLATGKHVSIDLDDCWEGKKPYPQPAYPAGFVRTKNLFYIGVQARAIKPTNQFAVFALDNNLNFVSRTLLDEYGAVAEIRLARGIDYAHNRIPMPWDGTLKGESIA